MVFVVTSLQCSLKERMGFWVSPITSFPAWQHPRGPSWELALLLSPSLQGRGNGGRLSAGWGPAPCSGCVCPPQEFWEASVYEHRRRGRTSVASAYPSFSTVANSYSAISTRLEAFSILLWAKAAVSLRGPWH